MLVWIVGGRRVGPSPSKCLSKDSTKAQGRVSCLVKSCCHSWGLQDLHGWPILCSPPQSLDLHNSRSLHLLSTSAVYSPGHSMGHTLDIIRISSTLTSDKLWLFSDHPSHLSIPLTFICSLLILSFLYPILLISF